MAGPDIPQVQAALNINVLFLIGAALALLLWWAFKNTRIGLVLRVVGDSTDAARAMGINPDRVRLLATAVGGSLAAIGGAYLSLYYPGSWNEGISSGQGLMAVALVIFARWNPIGCFLAALLFGGAGALGPALQSVGVTQGYYLFYAAPYVLTLVIHDRDVVADPFTCRCTRRAFPDEMKNLAMNGLGGFNKSEHGVGIDLVQLQLPVTMTKEDLARQTQVIVDLLGKARRNQAGMDLIVFPEYALHGLSMAINPEIMCTLDGPEVATFKRACRRQPHLGLLLHHGVQP